MLMKRWHSLSNVNRWSTHALLAPLGVATTTYLWANFWGTGQWLIWQDWSSFTDAFFFGGLVYSGLMAASWVLMKVVGLFLSAVFDEGRVEGSAERQGQTMVTGRREGMETALSEMWRLAQTDDAKSVIRQVANHHDVNIAAIGGGPSGSVTVTVVSPWDTLFKQLVDATTELRQRFGIHKFDGEVDLMLRHAVGAAIGDLKKEIERLNEIDARRARREPNKET